MKTTNKNYKRNNGNCETIMIANKYNFEKVSINNRIERREVQDKFIEVQEKNIYGRNLKTSNLMMKQQNTKATALSNKNYNVSPNKRSVSEKTKKTHFFLLIK